MARHPQTAAARPSLFRGSRDGKARGCDGSVRRGHRVDAGQLPSGPTLGFSPRTPPARAFLPVPLADTVPHADMPLPWSVWGLSAPFLEIAPAQRSLLPGGRQARWSQALAWAVQLSTSSLVNGPVFFFVVVVGSLIRICPPRARAVGSWVTKSTPVCVRARVCDVNDGSP